MPSRDGFSDGEHRAFLQHHIDTAQVGMFEALKKKQMATQLWREADLEREIHGKALTAAQLRRAELLNPRVHRESSGQRKITFLDEHDALPSPSSQYRAVRSEHGWIRGAGARNSSSPAKTKKARFEVVGIKRQKGAKNIWGQTAW